MLRVSSKTTREMCLDDRKFAANRLTTGSRQLPKRMATYNDNSALKNAVSGGNLRAEEASI